MGSRLRGNDGGGRAFFMQAYGDVGYKPQNNNPTLALPLEDIRGGNIHGRGNDGGVDCSSV